MSENILEIIVGEGTCGIAAGAKKVLHVCNEMAPNAKIRTVGCRGMCHREVIVEIKDGDKYFMYGDLNERNVKNVMDFHLGNSDKEDEILTDLLVTSTDEPNLEKGKYLERQTRIALRNVGQIDPTSIEEYIQRGGYKAIEKILKEEMLPMQVIEEVKESKLRGRGGAGFPTHLKWKFAHDAPGNKKYLICNGDEGDPGAFMDRSLLEGDPHNVIEGIAIAAFAIGANEGYAYIRAEYPLAVQHFNIAIEDAKKRNFLGDNILGSKFSFNLKVKQGAGAFVCGEETALISSIEGERGMPKIRPPFPAIKGLFSKPTIINNVETLANLPWIITHGGDAYSAKGTYDAKGTKVFALAGAIANGGLVEIPMGTTINQVLYRIGGGSKTGRPIKAVQLGGPSGGCIPEALFNTPISYNAINETGAIMGSGGMIVMDDKTCMVDLAKYFLEFTQLESCGKCTFCRIGTLRMNELLNKICDGEGTDKDFQELENLANQIKSATLCGLGQTAPNPVLTTIRYFKDEYLAHIHDKRCPAGVCKKLITHTIKHELCISCNLCKSACPTEAITGTPKERNTYNISQEKCINCGMCLEVCKSKAIIVE